MTSDTYTVVSHQLGYLMVVTVGDIKNQFQQPSLVNVDVSPMLTELLLDIVFALTYHCSHQNGLVRKYILL